MKPAGAMLVLIFIVMAAVSPPAAQQALTNDDVMEMLRAGLPDSVIVAKIRTSPSRFDLGTDALIALKRAGASERVLEAVLAAAAPSTSPPPSATAPALPAAPGIPGMPSLPGAMGLMGGTVSHLVGEQRREIPATAGQLSFSETLFGQRQEMVFPGRRARYRIADRRPVFLSTAGDLLLVRLRPGASLDDRNLETGSSNMLFSRSGIRDSIRVIIEREPRGGVRITPAEPLPPGEYGLMRETVMLPQIFDFGVD